MRSALRRTFDLLESAIVAPGARFIPDGDDALIVSYPKSGNTWVRALITALVSPDFSLVEMEKKVPDIYRSRVATLRRAHFFPFGGRVLKSHEAFRPDYRRVVYLVRDPRDVCVSYFRYLGTVQRHFDDRQISLDEFCENFMAGRIDRYGTWAEHVGSWGCAEAAAVLRLRYEDLRADTLDSLREVCSFLRIDSTEDQLRAAVDKCSLASLRQREELERKHWSVTRKAHASGRFFGSDVLTGVKWQDCPQFNVMSAKWRRLMGSLGYD